ncbi:uncharacterized protein BP5553_00233 [Venustampulla echinocandica]|uniref:Uncharacterized protein n=1 Tax=Venustampulla echinocandica TaxID=2656787 RepID=A0A370TXJ4_9HELO|nr:uncharacterized protein BP5553_00233 [Venustampulla echinocandica]RDL40254.1 hypothetical protein BP5553_00233 [Venustampulla echinocandica]
MEMVGVEVNYRAMTADLPSALGTSAENLRKASTEPVRVLDLRSGCNKFAPIYDFDSLFQVIEAIPRTSCDGLLEICKGPERKGRLTASMSYIHRTIKDYLEQPSI